MANLARKAIIMNRYTLPAVCGLLFLASCTDQGLGALQGVAETVLNQGQTTTNPLTNQEVISGLKEALVVGTEKGVSLASAADGFYKNDLLFIAFPPEAQAVKDKALKLGLNTQVDHFEETLNRAAEESVKTALPIFKQAVLEMSVADGFAILNGSDDAATAYLREKTTAELIQAFRPEAQKAIDKVELTKHWDPLANKYNLAVQFTGGEPINPDLTGYVTEKAVAGLFVHIASEEKNIRSNPGARVGDLLERVFGSLDQ